jgi:hypothetical protein
VKKWRVGTFSMGICLVLLGVTLLLSMMFQFEVVQIFWSWWPAILVLLGLEILVYLYFSKSEHPFVKYDIFSILFIGVLGMIGIFFFLLSSVGVVEEVSTMVSAREETWDIPPFDMSVPADVQKVVLDFGRHPVSVEGIDGAELSVFGTYRVSGSREGELVQNAEDYVTVNRKGDILYVSLKELPRKVGLVSNHISTELTVTVPLDTQLTVKGDTGLSLHPGRLQADWLVQNVAWVDVYLTDESDLRLNPDSVQIVSMGYDQWVEQVSVDRDETNIEPLTLGEGTHRLQVLKAGSVRIYQTAE